MTIAAALLPLLLCCSAPAAHASPNAYLTFVMHLEPNANNSSAYSPNIWPITRANIVFAARAIQEAGFCLEVLTSRDYLQAEMELGAAYTRQTGGKNLFVWLDSLPNVEVGPHVDENYIEGHNYADVTYELMQIGVPNHGIVGGTFYDTSYAGNYAQFFAGQQAMNHDFVLQGELILHGLASWNHEADYVDYGVWRASQDNAYMHDPASPLISLGGHRFTTETIVPKLDTLNSNAMSVFNIMVAQWQLTQRTFREDLQRDIQYWRQRNDVGWGTFTDLVGIWKSEYGQQPGYSPTDGFWPDEYDEFGLRIMD